MKRLAMMLMSAMFAAASLPCPAEPACTEVAVLPSVEAERGELTLADLLAQGTCPQLREAAARVSLGSAPRPGSVRVLDGRQIRLLIEELPNYALPNQALPNQALPNQALPYALPKPGESSGKEAAGMQISERIVVKRAGATKSCAEIARFVARAAPSQDGANAPSRWQEDLECAGARGIPADAPLELTKTAWNTALQRWEFGLRCALPEDCVPFLVWTREQKTPAGTGRRLPFLSQSSAAQPRGLTGTGGSVSERLVKPGQTATLIWDLAGIRVMLPVTCLDAGGLGQFVRVRFKNAARTLRAEVVGEGTLRANL